MKSRQNSDVYSKNKELLNVMIHKIYVFIFYYKLIRYKIYNKMFNIISSET